jgi:hypothetical protein
MRGTAWLGKAGLGKARTYRKSIHPWAGHGPVYPRKGKRPGGVGNGEAGRGKARQGKVFEK